MSLNVNVDERDDEFTEPFLEDFHKLLVTLLEPIDVQVIDIDSREYVQRYTFRCGDDTASFEFFYDSKKQFTKYTPFKLGSDSIELANKIDQVIIDGIREFIDSL
jgi:hypothetical protein